MKPKQKPTYAFLRSYKAVIAGFAGLFLSFFLIKLIAQAQTATSDSASTDANASSSAAQQEIDVNDQQIATLNQQIATYEAEIQQAGANKKTLQAAINALDLQRSKIQAQVKLTQTQINNTQLQIQQLGTEISSTEQTITTDELALATELRNLQKTDDQPLLMQMLSSGSLIATWNGLAADVQVKNSIQNQMQTLQTQETTLNTNQINSQQKQQTLTSQQQTLTTQQQSLTQTEQSKTQLLAQTNSQEANYEKLLAAAQAQLASFSAFTQNAGGSKLLGSETVCDSWGCYYSQRDSAWGNDKLNGTKYTLASDGCLITALAMVMTHYGYRDVTPITINSNPNNFATYYPAYLLVTVNIDGHSVTRTNTAIDATLATGNPVIVGINAYGGTHFVVLVSGSKGNYIMRDPYIANGDNVSFTANYSLRSIFSITKVTIS